MFSQQEGVFLLYRDCAIVVSSRGQNKTIPLTGQEIFMVDRRSRVNAILDVSSTASGLWLSIMHERIPLLDHPNRTLQENKEKRFSGFLQDIICWMIISLVGILVRGYYCVSPPFSLIGLLASRTSKAGEAGWGGGVGVEVRFLLLCLT